MSNEDWRELDESYRSALSGALQTARPSVEQEGGDERAGFEAWLAQVMSHHFSPELYLAKYEDSGEYRYNPAADYWKAWQARAALAQPSPVRSSLLINGYQLRAALDFIAPDGTAEQLESEACIEWRQQDADFLEAGLYAFCAEYPEEGGVLLDEEPTTAQPSPLQSEQAEAERPEVVARVVHSNPVVLGQCGPLNANDELMTVAQHAASVARWAEMFNRVEQERDAALARVAELTATRNRYGVDAHYFNKNLQRILRDFESFTPDELARSLIILAKVADEKVVAQAQHSVPEKVRTLLSRAQCEIEHLAECLENVCEDEEDFDVREDVADGRVVAADIAHMLAAAPGKEGV